MKKISLDNIEYTQMIDKHNNENFSKYVSIDDILKLTDIKIYHEKLSPYTKASKPHFHTKKEELFFIISGTPTLYLNEKEIELKSNDIVFFEPNNNETHYLINNTENEVTYLIISKNYEDDLVCYENK